MAGSGARTRRRTIPARSICSADPRKTRKPSRAANGVHLRRMVFGDNGLDRVAKSERGRGSDRRQPTMHGTTHNS